MACTMWTPGQSVIFFFRPTEDNGVKIVAVDLQLMAPISGVIQIHGDITKVGPVPVIRRFNWLIISLLVMVGKLIPFS